MPPEVITTLAMIEQTDDGEFIVNGGRGVQRGAEPVRPEARGGLPLQRLAGAAVGPMQFTDRRGNGTYSLVVGAAPPPIDPNFERGATNLLNAMKAAICLFDIELDQMHSEIRQAYRGNKKVLGIFPVAAYNGGPRNVTKLYRVIQRMGWTWPTCARRESSLVRTVHCPCLWTRARRRPPVAIPKYNNENRWYIEKYQNILGVFQ